MRKNVRTTFSLLFAALFLSGAALFSSRSALADTPVREPVRAEVVKQNDRAGYFYFSSPTCLYADEDGLTVSDGGRLERFSLADKTRAEPITGLPESVSDALPSGDRLILRTAAGALSVLDPATGGTAEIDPGRVFGSVCVDADGSVFAASAEKLFTVDPAAATATELSPPAYFSDRIPRRLAASGGKVYAAYPSDGNRYEDDLVCYSGYDAETPGFKSKKTVIASVGQTIDLDALPAGNGILALTTAGITRYGTKGAYLEKKASIEAPGLIALSCAGGSVFALTGKKSVAQFDAELTSRTEFLASSFSGPGFFDAPAGITTRKGNVYAADENNDRVQVLTPEGTSSVTEGLSRPKAVAADYAGTLYVAHSVNEITEFGADFKRRKTFSAFSDDVALIDLKAGAGYGLFALSDGGQLFRVDPQAETFEAVAQDDKVKAVAISPETDAPYLINDAGELKTLDGKGIARACAFAGSDGAGLPADARDLCLDNDGALYLLCADGSIVKYARNGDGAFEKKIGGPTEYADGFSVSDGASRIVMNTAEQDGFSAALAYGDLLISDTGEHALKVVKAADFSVNEHFSIGGRPEIPDAEEPTEAADGESILYRLNGECEVYAQAAEIRALGSLRADMRIIVPAFDPAEKFNFIVADNLAGGDDADPIVGYVYTSFINATPLGYTSEHPETCYTWIRNVPVYKYPSRNAPLLKNYKELKQNEPLTMLDFAYSVGEDDKVTYGYKDNYPLSPVTWFRVAVGPDGAVGYVVGEYTTTRKTDPQNTQFPRYNAEIVAANGNGSGAALYAKEENGSFSVLDEPPLAVGTQVEVVGAFDSSEPYTQIRFLVETAGEKRSVERWVATENLKYNGVNVVQIVAVVIIVVTLVLVGLVVWRLLSAKRRRRMSDVAPRR